MERIGSPTPTSLQELNRNETIDDLLRLASNKTHQMSRILYTGHKAAGTSVDQRAFRVALLLEEVGELMDAMVKYDEVEVLDALVDIEYVTTGTSIQFDLPHDEAFAAVCAANLTKGAGAATKSGDRGKGEDFVPADLHSIVNCHRKNL